MYILIGKGKIKSLIAQWNYNSGKCFTRGIWSTITLYGKKAELWRINRNYPGKVSVSLHAFRSYWRLFWAIESHEGFSRRETWSYPTWPVFVTSKWDGSARLADREPVKNIEQQNDSISRAIFNKLIPRAMYMNNCWGKRLKAERPFGNPCLNGS